jgi:hypothetical protein
MMSVRRVYVWTYLFMHLKNGRNAGNKAYARKGTTSRVMVVSRPKVSLDQIAATVQEIMDTISYSEFNFDSRTLAINF